MEVVEIENLKCGGCANTIKKGLLTVSGISNVLVDVDGSKVSFDTNSEEQVQFALSKLSSMGYPKVGESNNVLKKAKSYISCAVGKMNKED